MHGDLAHIGECLLALGSQRHMHLFFYSATHWG